MVSISIQTRTINTLYYSIAQTFSNSAINLYLGFVRLFNKSNEQPMINPLKKEYNQHMKLCLYLFSQILSNPKPYP